MRRFRPRVAGTLVQEQGRGEEARRYAALAKKFWSKAATQHFDAEMQWIRSLGLGEKTSSR